MCGIVAYMGHRSAVPTLLTGLRLLEYRGYDSTGVAVVTDGGLWIRKDVGRVAALAASMTDEPMSTVGIGHTRWATHGAVTQLNAHPHTDATGRIAVIHNGIVDNGAALRSSLEGQGVVFASETDTEVLPHLIRRHYDGDPVEAVRAALQHVRGTYGLAVLFADHPDVIVVARNGSPLVIGLGENENIVASDPQAIVAYTRRVIHLEDREMAAIRVDRADVMAIFGGKRRSSAVEVIDADYGVADDEGYPHFMLKEIYEQERSILRCLRGRLMAEEGNAKLGGLNMSPRDLAGIERIVNIGCGTSYHAGMAGAMAVEALARVPARAEIASEFRYRNPVIPRNALFFAVSQSGETIDTLGAVQEILLKGGEVRGIVNVVGSTIARAVGQGVYVHSGPEIAVASTKAFTSQVAAMLVYTLMLARGRSLTLDQGRAAVAELLAVPEKVGRYLANPGPIDKAIVAVKDARYVLFLGRGYSYPVALEGALKLKEIAYIPCEGYPAGEMKHGPIAMIDPGTPVILVALRDGQREKTMANLREVQARGAYLIVVHTEGDDEMAALADVSIPVPETADWASPLVTVLPLQLIAYGTGVALGRDIDKPRNLAKSVTVE